ncbi:hypothetical protein [Streptomyces gobiensis]|nr:hypothetical protein [Streptomyces gobiensis]
MHRDVHGESWIDPDSELAECLGVAVAAEYLRAILGWSDDR